MGNTRVMFLGGISLVLGIFTLGLVGVATDSSLSSDIHAYQSQAEVIADAGLQLGISRLDTKDYSFYSYRKSVFGGLVSYYSDYGYIGVGTARIIVMSEYKNITTYQVALVKRVDADWSRDRWIVLKRYTTTNASEF